MPGMMVPLRSGLGLDCQRPHPCDCDIPSGLHFGKPRQVNHLSPEVQDQPAQHGEHLPPPTQTCRLYKKIEKLECTDEGSPGFLTPQLWLHKIQRFGHNSFLSKGISVTQLWGSVVFRMRILRLRGSPMTSCKRKPMQRHIECDSGSMQDELQTLGNWLTRRCRCGSLS
ncbi:hypothetical protein AAY473_010631, partial [Plecturocebus cupreus]